MPVQPLPDGLGVLGCSSSPAPSYWGTTPSQRSARFIDFGLGHTATTQIGIRCLQGSAHRRQSSVRPAS